MKTKLKKTKNKKPVIPQSQEDNLKASLIAKIATVNRKLAKKSQSSPETSPENFTPATIVERRKNQRERGLDALGPRRR